MSSAPRRRLLSLLWKPALDDEIADELAFHLEMRAREYAARGLAPAAAAAAARRRFGDLASVAAACRAIGRGRDRARRRAGWLGELARDLRLAGRRLGERPGSTLLVVLALAVGLAGAATAWQVARARPRPFVEPAGLLRLRQASPRGVQLAASVPDYADWRRLSRSFAGMAAFETVEANLAAGGPASERVLAARATASLLPLLGVRPLLGRGFTVREAARGRGGDHRVAVVSHALWRRRFGVDPRIVGRALWLDGVPLTVVGVMPASFGQPAGVGLWMPLTAHGPQHGATRDHHRLEVIARLRPGVSARQATAELAAVAAAVARNHPETRAGWGVEVRALPAAWTAERWARRTRLLLAAAGLLWLLASATAANLLWARASSRQHEIDLRAALGGGRGRIVRQLYAEGLLLAMLGAAVALLLAGASTAMLRQAAGRAPLAAAMEGAAAAEAPEATPAALAAIPRLDAGGAGLVLALALLSSLVCGLGPALQAARPGLHETVRQSSRLTTRRERWVRDALVAVELAVATTLLVTAWLLLASFLRLDRADPGFDADHVLSLRLALNGERFPPAARRALLRRLEERLTQMPGVAAGFVSTAPLAAERPAEPFTLEPEPGAGGRRELLAAEWRVVTPGFFSALGVWPLAGRLLGPADRDMRHPVALIDAGFAERAWSGGAQDPLRLVGKRLRWTAGGRDLTVVGVIAGMRDLDLEAGPRPVVLLPYEEMPWRSMALVVRPPAGAAPAPQASLAELVRREIGALAPGLPVSPVRWLEVARRQEVAGPRLGSWLVALFAAAALGLAVSGVHSTAAAAVARRTREIAVRQALGAAGGDVMRLVLGRGLFSTLLGLAIGTGGALLFSRLLAGLLYETSAVSPGVYAGAALLLGSVAMLACVLPARRAARISPVLALRRE
jgi:putative ABC transport system permease protein